MMVYRMLKNERSEYGRRIRKAYESGAVDCQWNDIHVLQPRDDQISNTITGVIKDYLICIIECEDGLTEQQALDMFF